MSRADIEQIKIDHIIEGPDYRFVCVTIGGRTHNLRIYKDGLVESYEGGRFVQLPPELAEEIRLILEQAQKQNIPTFTMHNGSH